MAEPTVDYPILASVEMSPDMVEGAIIDAMLDTVSSGHQSPTFLKLSRLLIAIRGQRQSEDPPSWGPAARDTSPPG